MLNACSHAAAAVAASVTLVIGSAWAQDVTGAGASFPAPVYAKWADAFNKATGARVNDQSVVNIKGITPGQIKLTGTVLADIYLGRVTK
jgi:phosphate transport system substrate-binding protein